MQRDGINKSKCLEQELEELQSMIKKVALDQQMRGDEELRSSADGLIQTKREEQDLGRARNIAAHGQTKVERIVMDASVRVCREGGVRAPADQ